MSQLVPSFAPPEPPPIRPLAPELLDLAEACLQQTADAALEARIASAADISHATNLTREAHFAGKPCEFIEVLARTLGYTEEHISRAIREIGDKLAIHLNPLPVLIPFAGKLIAPSAFYDSFDHLHETARALLSPVVFAEDTDAIGTASINPIASMILADEIRAAAFKRVGIRPFVTIARLDYESWSFLCRKHFEL